MVKTKPTNPTFSVQQSILNKALNICSKALSDSKIMPIYESFLFDITPGKIDISACDGRIIISTQIDVSASMQMKICISGRKLQDYIAKSANEILLFEIITHVVPESTETIINPITNVLREVVTPEQISFSLLIKGFSGKCTLAIDLGYDFPQISNNDSLGFQLPAIDFLEMLYKTMFAISDDQLRPSATGLNIAIELGKVTATALDFNTVSTITSAAELDFSANFIIPKKALQQIQSLSPVGMMECKISQSAISIQFGSVSITALLIDEKFPDYKSITPTKNHIDFVTSKSALIIALKRVLPFSDAGKLVKLNISTSEMLLIAENWEYSEEATEIVPGALCNGEPIIIGVNGEKLLAILNVITDDRVWFSFSSPKTAMIITESERNIAGNKDNLFLMMPLFFTV